MAVLTWTPSPTAVPMAVRASWDTQQRPSYNPNAPRKLKPNPNPNLKPSPTVTLSTRTDPSVFDILKRPTQEATPVKEDFDDSYMGYERWLPNPPKVEKPRSVFNAATLAYIGDCIYEDALLQELLNDSFLSNNERDVLRWGKNISSTKTRTKKRTGAAVYNRASSLETLIGYLYLTNVNRLEKLMAKLGFSTGASTEMILKEVNGAKPVQ
ncbi:uncharacterized protein LOC111318607 isoform X2 [Durio zibethinus]|uniref:Uncharacterized protein LOC111318607 isoform X2 n=1 Tax=Durio zibethinus TaxID=66656 RepID=A0A6P6BJI5_DURZI|nr:uncharacterized protein LOC111318607 isoform X2 [Durio zibethinus]